MQLWFRLDDFFSLDYADARTNLLPRVRSRSVRHRVGSRGSTRWNAVRVAPDLPSSASPSSTSVRPTWAAKSEDEEGLFPPGRAVRPRIR